MYSIGRRSDTVYSMSESKVKLFNGIKIGTRNMVKLVTRVLIITKVFVIFPIFVYVLYLNSADGTLPFKIVLPIVLVGVIIVFWLDTIDRIRVYQYEVLNKEPILATVENYPGTYEI